MDACIFVLTINALMPVYGPDKVTQVDQLSIGDKVCVTRIEPGDWVTAHWASGNVGHTGFLHGVTIKQPAQPNEPTPREEQYDVPPPQTPAPAPEDTTPNIPPAPQNYRRNTEPQAPITRPVALVMQCYPQQSTPYSVVYVNGHGAVIGGKTGRTTEYPVIDEHDDVGNHVFYVAMKRRDQVRTVYLAFDYSQRGEDVSALVTKATGQKAKDKCEINWELTK
jgi:hypothetical protein